MKTVFLLFIITATIDSLVEWLDLKSNQRELPNELKDTYTQEEYKRAQSYQTENFKLFFFKRWFFTILLLIFIGLKGLNSLDEWVRQIVPASSYNNIFYGLVFVGSLSLMKVILSIPFSLYDTFVIEEKYGFNRTTLSLYFIDLLKGFVLSIILGTPILAFIIYFYEALGEMAWFYSWIVVTGFQVLLTFIAPVVILPLFNKFDPLPEGELKERIKEYNSKQNFKIGGVFVMDSSKRTTKSNAFFTGFGKLKKLVLFDELISKLTVEELVSVFAHEVGHYKRGHILKSIFLSIISTGAFFYLISLLLNQPILFNAFYMENISTYASLVLIGILLSPIFRYLSVFSNGISRKFEFEADEFSAKTYEHFDALISGLKKLSKDNLSALNPHPLKVLLDYSHPPILERIKRLTTQ